MEEQQKQFLQLHVIEQVSYKVISDKLNVPSETLSKWYEELKSERETIAKVLTLHGRKGISLSRLEFYNWYLAQERKCHYCGINEEQIKLLLDKELIHTKRITTRGRTLELDRKASELKYNNLDNIVLACYWCNNAKTDEFSYEEFLEVGKEFSSIWEKRLAK